MPYTACRATCGAIALVLAAVTSQSATLPRLTADDYVAIQQLYATYVFALDTGDGERLANTFTVDGEFVGSRGAGHGEGERPVLKGTAALRDMGSARAGGRHFTANLVITPMVGGVQGNCYLLLLNVKTSPASVVETAIYDDKLVKTTQGWRFVRRVVWRDDDDLT